jgi:hypothetical protein
VSSTAKLPTRAPRTTGTSRRGSLLELVDRKRKPPAAPRSLDTPARAVWRELWREPVSDLWRETDRALVVRLVRLRLRLENEADSPGWVYSSASSLEDRLLLNPRARRAAGVVYVPAPSPADRKNGVRRLDERRRQRLARGV